MPDSDRELFDRWQAGEALAGEALAGRHQRAVEGFFARRAASAAPDLAQETWLECLKSHERFRGDASFRTFLFAVAHNVLRGHVRRSGREPDLGIADFAISQPSPPSLLDRRREFALVQSALGQLAEEHRMLLGLTYDEQLSSEQVAELLEVPSATVRTRLRRARELLREAVERTAREDPALLRSALEVFDLWAEEPQR